SCCLRQRRGNSGITGIGNPNLSYAINSEIIFLVWLYGQNRTGQGHYEYQPSTYRNHFRYRAYRFDFLHYCLPLSVMYQKICTEGLQPQTPENKGDRSCLHRISEATAVTNRERSPEESFAQGLPGSRETELRRDVRPL